MNTPILRTLLLSLLLAFAGCTIDNRDDDDGDPPDDRNFEAVSDILDDAVANADIEGYTFALTDLDGELYSDSAGAEIGTVLPLASASKPLAAAAILTLVDDGVLNLDTPIYTYLNAAGISWPNNDGQKSLITMRMLLSHTSGLPALPDTPTCVDQATGTLAGCVAIIASNSVPLAEAPGTTFLYGGTDFQVAGYIAVVLSGAGNWQAFFNQAIIQPLGLANQMGYEGGANPRIAGGAAASAPAYAKFLRMLLNLGILGNVRVLEQNTVMAMVSDQLKPPATVAAINTYEDDNAFTPYGAFGSSYPQYGLGFFLTGAARRAPSLGPEASSQGLFGATPWIDFDQDYAAVLLLTEDNTGTGVLPISRTLWNELRTFILGELD